MIREENKDTMTTYEYGNRNADVVLVQPVDEQDLSVIENEVQELSRLSDRDFRLIAVKVNDWNKDLAPWKAPAVFGKQDFGEGAQETLEEILKLCTEENKTYIIGGYSLAGLFSLWAVYQTEVFSAAAAASPSVWFPGFMDYIKSHEIRSRKVYLSLGDKEEKTRNKTMAAVGDCIREVYEVLKTDGIDCTLEWNKGNHFTESDLRTAKAYAWVLNRL